MRLNYNQFLAVVYADLFDYPLTPDESKLWVISSAGKKLQGEVWREGKYFCLPGRKKIIFLRLAGEKILEKRKTEAQAIANRLQKIPMVAAVFLTGSGAAGNTKKQADIDIMIITYPNTVWITRACVFIWLKLTGQFKSPVCPNIFLDTDHLPISQKNLFTAHEVLQAKCLCDKNRVHNMWLRRNSWTNEYLPSAYKRLMTKNMDPVEVSRDRLTEILLLPLEAVAFFLQYLYQKPKQTYEKVGWGHAFFHPVDRSKVVLKKFQERLLKYTS